MYIYINLPARLQLSWCISVLFIKMVRVLLALRICET
jgi:hypothetical protein